MNKDAILKAVSEAFERGISIVPPAQDGTKRPAVRSWGAFQKRRASRKVLDEWYANGRTGVGWVCGAISGGLEVIDFDDREIYKEYKRMAEAAGLSDLVARIERGYLETSPNGAHWPYFCTEVSGNNKLATKRVGKHVRCLIETRGEGGYIIVAPTFGGVNSKGTYVLQQGSIGTIATVTPEERRELHALARVFDEGTVPKDEFRSTTSGHGSRPGDEYSGRTTWPEVLEPHGWSEVYTRLETTAWRRPGKEFGISATTNYKDSDLLYVFTTSSVFESCRGINKFAAYTILNHDGDFGAAARELALLGYGSAVDPGIDISGVLSQVRRQIRDAPTGPFPTDLLRVPGMVGDLADFINRTSSKPQPILALGAALAAVGTIVGRKVATETNERSNIYILGVAHTGSGKERARQAIREVFEAAGAGPRVSVDDLASDAAINTAVQNCPSSLFLLDEVGRLLKALASDRVPHYYANIVSTLLKLYNQASTTYWGKTYADSKRNVGVIQPCLSLYGTTVRSRLIESMNRDQVADGFLSRLLVFESEDVDPDWTQVKDTSIPPRLIEQFIRWERRSINDRDSAGNIEKVMLPAPCKVTATPEAAGVFHDLEADMKALRARLRAAGEEDGLYARVGSSARKLALIRACGVAFEQPEITREHAEWSANLSVYLCHRMADRIATSVADNATEANLRRVAQFIEAAGKRGISRAKLTRKTYWLKGLDRQDVVRTLIESGQVVARESRATRTKLTTYFWVA